jgi:signal transduction histidine kinase/ligand-binding sensor domain-containing protein/DNA-binding response OmpR family regulator
MRKGLIHLTIIFHLLFPCKLAFGQLNDKYLRQITIEDGLSNETVNCVYKDKSGFFWFGTINGLNRFDGYKTIIYKTDSRDKQSISDNIISDIIEDEEGFLWVATNRGLNRLNRRTNTFDRFFYDPTDLNTIGCNKISKLFIDSSGDLWIGTLDGLNKYDSKTNFFTRFNLDPNPKGSFKNNDITCITEDSRGNLWISSWLGWLSKFDKKTGRFKSFLYPKNTLLYSDISTINRLQFKDPGHLLIFYNNYLSAEFDTDKEEFSLLPTDKGFPGKILWKTLDSQGLEWCFDGINFYIFKPETNSYSRVPFDKANPIADFMRPPVKILNDQQGNFWIINSVFECYKYEQGGNKFAQFFHPLKFGESKHQDYVLAFAHDRYGNLWLGTYNNGLIVLNGKGELMDRIMQNGESGSILSNFITSFSIDSSHIWIGTDLGISIMDIKTRKVVKNIRQQESCTNCLNDNYIKQLFRDSKNNYWIPTSESLDFLDTKTNVITHYSINNLQGLSHFNVSAIIEDNEGYIWIGTFDGLNIFDYKTRTFNTTFAEESKKKLSDSHVNSDGLYQAKDGKIWIATRKGLNFYDKSTNQFNQINPPNEKLKDYIYGMMEDASGNLWCVSDYVLYKLRYKDSLDIKYYDKSSGLAINPTKYYKSDDGRFFFGGRKNGYYAFHPDSLNINPFAPAVYITGFMLFNNPVKVGTTEQPTPLKESIEFADKLTLNYRQSFITFEFSSLNYTISEKNLFAYKMIGFDDQWIYTDASRRYATYTNLDAGNYTFMVKASNNDGVWNEKGTKIQLTVLPPPWKSPLAYFVYILLILTFLIWGRAISLKKERAKARIKLERIKTENEIEFNQMKIKFFTYISHELRTPLTLISGPLDKLISLAKETDWSGTHHHYLPLIQRNVARLKELTNQLLDLRKIDTGAMKLELSKGDLLSFTKNLCNNFQSIAENRGIELIFFSSVENINTWFDPDKIDKIVSNLIGNAIKYSGKGDRVEVLFTKTGKSGDPSGLEFVQIAVSDNGPGISVTHLPYIFDQFYQVGDSKTKKPDGSGIGLALTKELVLIHCGQIKAESEFGKGSRFEVILPIDLENMTNYELTKDVIDLNNYAPESGSYFTIGSNLNKNSKETRKKSADDSDIKILVVEDNVDLREYIKGFLVDDFDVLEAENGENGFDMAKNSLPDLIISDVMMPVMDGIELTKKIKEDEHTSHIPVILLTALASVDKKYLGYQIGADDYVTKPFNQDLLLMRINNLIQSRQKLQNYYLNNLKKHSTLFSAEPKEIEVIGIDERFLDKLVKIVEKKIDDPDFTVEVLASEMGMVSRVLYRKLKALINQNPGDFIFEMRMKRALQILLQRKVPVSEIADMVGFNDRKYFSICFRKYYGLSPTAYLKKNSHE